MDNFLKVIAGILIAVMLALMLNKQSKDLSLLIVLAVCAMTLAALTTYLQPVVDFFDRMQLLGNLDGNMIKTMVKVLGISILSEITATVCADSGNASMGKSVQLLGVAVILWMLLPLLSQMLDLLESILGAV